MGKAMSTLDFILDKYGLSYDPAKNRPVEIPNVGRDNLAALLSELDFKTGAEIGVGRGIFFEVLCRTNPSMKFYAVDPWEPYEAYRPRPDQNPEQKYVTRRWCKFFFNDASIRLAKYDNCQIVKRPSVEAVKQFKDESLDFVYIDANHAYSYVMEDITLWSKKVRSGGIVSGHDYYRLPSGSVSIIEVKQAVNDYIAKNDIRPLILWGKDNLPGVKHDGIRSWSWVKV